MNKTTCLALLVVLLVLCQMMAPASAATIQAEEQTATGSKPELVWETVTITARHTNPWNNWVKFSKPFGVEFGTVGKENPESFLTAFCRLNDFENSRQALWSLPADEWVIPIRLSIPLPSPVPNPEIPVLQGEVQKLHEEVAGLKKEAEEASWEISEKDKRVAYLESLIKKKEEDRFNCLILPLILFGLLAFGVMILWFFSMQNLRKKNRELRKENDKLRKEKVEKDTELEQTKRNLADKESQASEIVADLLAITSPETPFKDEGSDPASNREMLPSLPPLSSDPSLAPNDFLPEEISGENFLPEDPKEVGLVTKNDKTFIQIPVELLGGKHRDSLTHLEFEVLGWDANNKPLSVKTDGSRDPVHLHSHYDGKTPETFAKLRKHLRRNKASREAVGLIIEGEDRLAVPKGKISPERSGERKKLSANPSTT